MCVNWVQVGNLSWSWCHSLEIPHVLPFMNDLEILNQDMKGGGVAIGHRRDQQKGHDFVMKLGWPSSTLSGVAASSFCILNFLTFPC